MRPAFPHRDIRFNVISKVQATPRSSHASDGYLSAQGSALFSYVSSALGWLTNSPARTVTYSLCMHPITETRDVEPSGARLPAALGTRCTRELGVANICQNKAE